MMAGGAGRRSEELRLTGAVKGEVVARGGGEVIAGGGGPRVDEAVNPAVAHVKAWRLEADGNRGWTDDVLFPGERERREYLRDARNFNYVIEEGVMGFPGSYIARWSVCRPGEIGRGESREVGPVVRHRAGG